LQHHADYMIGVAVIDRFSYHTLEFLDRIGMDSNKTVLDLVGYLNAITCFLTLASLLFMIQLSLKQSLNGGLTSTLVSWMR
jgi:glycosylphosphatidylinositol transamidase (GPIT) subunit GPI8